jgi:hypothetical protein
MPLRVPSNSAELLGTPRLAMRSADEPAGKRCFWGSLLAESEVANRLQSLTQMHFRKASGDQVLDEPVRIPSAKAAAR